jgi:hypothetical protein
MERRCQSSYNLLNLPVGSQSFGFAKTWFFGFSSTLAKLVLLLIVHDLATPHDSFDDNGTGNEASEKDSALLKARTAGHALTIALTLIHDLATAQDLFDGYAEPLCDHGCLRKSDRLSFGPCHDRGSQRRKRHILRPVLFHV